MGERVLEHSSKRRFRARCEEHCAGSTRSAVEDATLMKETLEGLGFEFNGWGGKDELEGGAQYLKTWQRTVDSASIWQRP